MALREASPSPTSQPPQEHQICLHLQSIHFTLLYVGKLVTHLDMQLGGHTNNYAEFGANNKLTWQHLCMQQLVEQEYSWWSRRSRSRRSRTTGGQEERFWQASKSTNQWVPLWSILWTLILVAIGIWQIQYLKNFLKAKKLV